MKKSKLTTKNGRYLFIDVPPGTWDVTVTMGGYKAQVKSAKISYEVKRKRNFKMEQE